MGKGQAKGKVRSAPRTGNTHAITSGMQTHNPPSPMLIASRYAPALAQGDLEKRKGLPVSPYMDRESSSAARFQVALIDYCINPVFVALTRLFPEMQVWLPLPSPPPHTAFILLNLLPHLWWPVRAATVGEASSVASQNS